jgi:chromosome segregation ATPase
VEDLKKVIRNLEAGLKSHKETASLIETQHRKAIVDRGQFEQAKDAATKENATLVAEIETLNSKLQSSNALNESLTAEVTRLQHAPLREQDSEALVLQQLEVAKKQAEESAKEIAKLTKRVDNLQGDRDYFQLQYQDAFNSASNARIESTGLQERLKEAERNASANLAKIHEINARASVDEYVRRVDEGKTILAERERELDRLRDEVRFLKNGRRETRQASVPRSPRMGMMSPRPGRGIGGSASRGTSPAPLAVIDGASGLPGIQYLYPQQGNPRLTHLRD